MKIEYGKRRDFWGYLSSLRYLEQAFRAVGMNVDITLSLYDDGVKYLSIEDGHNSHVIKLNDLTPEQASKMAACFLANGLFKSSCCPYPKEKKNA
jgi:hypothetical protein